MIRRLLGSFGRDRSGTAALEFAGIGGLLIVSALNTADVGRYAWQAAQVTEAAQAGAQAALVGCDLDHTPATLNCPALNTAVAQGVQATQLGAYVFVNGPIIEGYYCRDVTGGLTRVSDASSRPDDCSADVHAAGSAEPTLYLEVNVAFIYQPMFPGITVAASFPLEITRSAWVRMA
jgi:Flp pilus assembly protein TadG